MKRQSLSQSQTRRRRGVKGLAYVTAVAMVATPAVIFATSASADQVTTTAPSAAHGHGIFLEGLGVDVAGAAYANSNFNTDKGLNRDSINVSVLENLAQLELGTVTLPLIKTADQTDGLLDLGNLGLLESSALSDNSNTAYSASGLLGDDGALALDRYTDEDLEPATVDLSGLLEQILGETTVETVLDTAELNVGALGAEADAVNSTTDSVNVTDQYVLTDLNLDLHSELVGGLVNEVDGIVEEVVQPIQGLLAPGGAVANLVGGVINVINAIPGVNATLNELGIDTIPLTQAIQNEVFNTTLSNTEESIVIDLDEGLIHIDLEEIVVDSTGSADLNSLPANTEVLKPATIATIVDGVEEALLGNSANSLVTKLSTVINDYLYDVVLTVDIEVTVLGIVTAPITVIGTLGGFIGQAGHSDPVVDTSQINVAGVPAGTVLTPIIGLLNGLISDIGGVLEPVVDGVLGGLGTTLTGTLTPVVTPLLDVLDPLLSALVQIRVNEQPTAAPLNSDGDLGANSFTVRALSVNLLPLVSTASKGNVALQLGSATVLAEDADDNGNVNASASAAASASADDDSNTSAHAAAQAAADADANSTVSAAADVSASAAAQVAAQADASSDASADATSEANAAAAAAAQATADSDADSASNVSASADATSAADADANAAAAAAAESAADTDASSDASAAASADDDSNASASASASASADDDSNASAQAAAQAAAHVDANSTASAAADVNANAAASVAATADASTTASADATSEANASAQAAAQSTSDADSVSNANATAAADAMAAADATSAAAAAAEAAADSDSSADASAAASVAAAADANVDADSTADVTAAADVDADAASEASASTSASASAAASANGDASGGGLPSTGGAVPFWLIAVMVLSLATGVTLVVGARMRSRKLAQAEDGQ